ncbi:MAG TPA: hypothetical protein VMM84_19625 [Pyrinomonadaceae bacterium]|nr:hypothetical protein [Pyrinomonadaceae bacterium]
MIETSNSVDPETGGEDGAPATVAPSVPPLELQSVNISTSADTYELAELMQYHDRAFVVSVYAALQKRSPSDAELAGTLNDLRSGRQTKLKIIESLAARSTVRVAGLPAPWLRRLSGWPVIGYMLRLSSGLARLPMLMRHQQQFEVYALAKQQQIADYLNEVMGPAVRKAEEDSPVIAELSATVNDAVDSVMMLSDSLIEVSSRQGELQDQQNDLRRDYDVTAAAQRDFLVHEQRVIVETQKVAFSELQAQIDDLQKVYEMKLAELHTEVCRLRKLVERSGEGDREPDSKSEQL